MKMERKITQIPLIETAEETLYYNCLFVICLILKPRFLIDNFLL